MKKMKKNTKTTNGMITKKNRHISDGLTNREVKRTCKLLARFEYVDTVNIYNTDSFYEDNKGNIIFICEHDREPYGFPKEISEDDFFAMLDTYLKHTECTYLDEEYFDFR